MASSLWAQAARSCALSSTQAVRSVPVLRRSFVALAARPNVRSFPSTSRCQSSVATAAAPESSKPQSSRNEMTEDTRIPFSTLKGVIHPATLKAITEKPFKHTHMSVVQQKVFPLLPDLAEPYSKNAPEKGPRDLLVKAKTGTGKTMGFLVPAIEARLKALDAYAEASVRDAGAESSSALLEKARRAFARDTVGTLVISPTRELATQIATEAKKLTEHHRGLGVHLFVGGESKREQMRTWSRSSRDIVVSTPGRLRDLLMTEPDVESAMGKAQVLVLDEADTLLDMGFRDDIEAIKGYLPPTPERQTFLFSATVSRAIQQIARSTLSKSHSFINCVSEDDSPVHAHVNQYHTVLPSAEHQIPHLLRLLAHDQLMNPGHSKIIVFLPTTKMTQLFSTVLRQLSQSVLPAGRSTKVYEIHSKRSMPQRTTTSDMFRNDKSGASVLVTSDVSARGVDYPGVTRVIQVGVPVSADQYVHRVGRTGRAGTAGRGDIVLLPWEIGFVTWQLTDVPLKPLTVSELATQVKELATEFDQDPAAFFSRAPGMVAAPAPSSSRDRRAPRTLTHKDFITPTAALSEEIERCVLDLQAKLDERDIEETFMSLLGYYMSRSGDLRTRKDIIVEGCKAWTTGACGLPSAPYVSQQFLAKLGANETRGNKGINASRYARESKDRWGGRGSVKGRQMGLTREAVYAERDNAAHSGGFDARTTREGGSGYGRSREGGSFSRPREGGFSGGRSEGGSFSRPREGGFNSGRSEGGYGSRDREGGSFTRPREGGYTGGGSSNFGRRDSGGYAGRSGGGSGGYGGNRDGGRW